MRRLIIFGVLLILLIIGGGLTAQLATGNVSVILPVLTTTQVSDASTMVVEPWKAEQLFMLISFILINVIGIGVTLAIIFWLLDRSYQNTTLKETGSVTSVGTTIEIKNADKVSLPAKSE